MGNSDLSSPSLSPSLAERIHGGDAGAISSFRELHLEQTKAYCQQACTAELVDEAVSAAFVDFLGRVTESPVGAEDLESTLLQATRAAAAPRMSVEGGQPECTAVPELLAARSNHELPGDERALREHLRDCPVCQETRTRMERAERMFQPVPQPPPQPPAPEPPPQPPAPQSPRQPEPPGPAGPIIVRRRSGGLVGAVRKRIRPPLS